MATTKTKKPVKKAKAKTNGLNLKITLGESTIIGSLGLTEKRGDQIMKLIWKTREARKEDGEMEVQEMGELIGRIVDSGEIKDLQEFAFLCYVTGGMQAATMNSPRIAEIIKKIKAELGEEGVNKLKKRFDDNTDESNNS